MSLIMEPRRQLCIWLVVLATLFTTLVTIFTIFPTKHAGESALALETGLTQPPETCVITPNITFYLLSDNKSFQQLTDWARSDPDEMSCALPELVPQLYAGNVSAFLPLLHFVEGLPTVGNQIIGFSAIYNQVESFSVLPPVPQLLQLVEGVKRLNEKSANDESLGAGVLLKLANLNQDLSSLLVIGQNADCNITNVAYQHQLFATSQGFPDSLYLTSAAVQLEWRVQPNVDTGKLLFRISENNADFLYSSESNPNQDPRDPKYRLKAEERHVLMGNPVPPEADGEWKLVSVGSSQGNHFRISASKSDGVMFAHRTEMVSGDGGDLRRVILGSNDKRRLQNQDYISEADEWILDCRPLV